jgi:4-hydroxy-3-methylbut-2-en-1-yl diphosphate reductase
MAGAPLVILAPLGVEALALRRGRSPMSEEPDRTVVIRTGAGPKRSAAAMLRRPAGPGPTVIAGVGGALVAGLRPGDLVVADRILAADGTVVRELAGAALLAGVLRRQGLQARVGTIISTDKVVRGSAARAALAATGAVAVDMESAAIAGALAAAPGGATRPGALGSSLGATGAFAVVRAIADTVERELLSPATVTGGIAALRSLRAAVPAIEAWAAATGSRRVLLAEPRSFCAGVDRAIQTVQRALDRFGAPVYVRRQIVHNRHVVEDLEARGAVFIDELGQVPEGATTVYSAHGVGLAVRAEAEAKGLRVIDATCPLVAKVHNEVRRFTAAGRQVVVVGHAGHDEIEGTLGQTDGMLLVERPADVAALAVTDPSRMAYTTQTTLSPSDVEEVVDALRQRWPDIVGPPAADICYATHNRQRAVAAIADDCDLVLVVGSANSSNSHRLVEVAERAGTRAKLIDDVSDLDPAWLADAHIVGVTAGASAPEALVGAVVAALVDLGASAPEIVSVTTESVSFSLPPEVR